jgi:hypothetical protein
MFPTPADGALVCVMSILDQTMEKSTRFEAGKKCTLPAHQNIMINLNDPLEEN